jgi:hypothetical protein
MAITSADEVLFCYSEGCSDGSLGAAELTAYRGVDFHPDGVCQHSLVTTSNATFIVCASA